MAIRVDESVPMLAAGLPSDQHCAACDASWQDTHASPQCASCGGLLSVRHAHPTDADGAPLSPTALRASFAEHCCARPAGHTSGVWRFESLVMPGARHTIVSWPEGNTALVQRRQIAEYVGVDSLLCKHEGMNPTGSFKDRGMTVGTTQAVRVGATAVACASTGNTSASLAAYAAHAGLPALVFVPAGQVALGKLTQTLAYGARTLLVRGDFDDCLRLVQECASELGIYLLNSINPWRIEGQKTIVLELLQQLGWQAPDWIVLPAGNLGNTSAFGKALREAHALGLIDRVPRLAAVQAEGASPFARSFADSFRTRHTMRAETLATAIRIGDPASHDRAVQAIAFTNGVVTAVRDEDIVTAKRVIDAAGVGCEPASAASVAGARSLVREGVIKAHEQVVAVLTGHVLKDPGMLVRMHQDAEFPAAPPNAPIEIDASVAAVAALLASDANGFPATRAS